MTMFQRIVAVTLCGCGVIGGAYAGRHMQEIGQKGKVFSLEEISIPVGETIRVVNDDNVLHSLLLTAPDGQRSALGTQKPGEQTDITLDQLGDYVTRCGIHPGMKLLIHTR